MIYSREEGHTFGGKLSLFGDWEGPQCIVDNSSKKILARGRPTPLGLFQHAFGEHLVTQSLPKNALESL